MQSLFKFVPVALIATVVGTVAGYSLHRSATETVNVCAIPKSGAHEPAVRANETGRATASAEAGMDWSWKRWPSVTDF